MAGPGGKGTRVEHHGSAKVEKVMHEFKEGTLHSGSPTGPPVKSRGQAIAIALSEAKRAGHLGFKK